MTVLAVIPARGGSKSIPRKNLAMLNGRPLIAYSIDAGRNASSIDSLLVSTDDAEIAAAAKAAGAKVPFLRPAELATDSAPMLGVLLHALQWHEQNQTIADAVVLLQPTSPLRTGRHIDEAVALFFAHQASSVVSVVEVPHQFNPVSVLRLDGAHLRPFLDTGAVYRRQDKPRFYARNGPAVLVCAAATLKSGELYGRQCIPYVMSAGDSLDIDEPSDLAYAEWLLQRRSSESGAQATLGGGRSGSSLL